MGQGFLGQLNQIEWSTLIRESPTVRSTHAAAADL